MNVKDVPEERLIEEDDPNLPGLIAQQHLEDLETATSRGAVPAPKTRPATETVSPGWTPPIG